MYNGGRKMLLPFLGKAGKYPYFKCIIRDMIEMEYRVKDAYRVFWKKHFTFGVEDGACQSTVGYAHGGKCGSSQRHYRSKVRS